MERKYHMVMKRTVREEDSDDIGSEDNSVSMEGGSDGASSEEDDIELLPLQLLMYGEQLTLELDKNCITEYGYANDIDVNVISGQLLKINQLYNKSYDLFLDLNTDLKLLLEKSRSRDKDDNRVPPGSSAVKRDLNDKRYFLSLLCINKSIIADRRGSLYNEIIDNLKEALIWFPRSIEANHMLAKFLHPTADTEEKLEKVEYLLKKAIACGEQMENSGESKEFLEEMGLYIKREEGAYTSAKSYLSLLQCQSNRSKHSIKHLKSLGYTHRLASSILNYHTPNSSSESTCSSTTPLPSDPYVVGIDSTLPPAMLEHMKQVFSSDSPFWSEHNYDFLSNSSRTNGYFSYLYDLQQHQPTNSIEQIIEYINNIVCKYYPVVATECKYAEWWVHSRPHSSGHQLHFDSDETRLHKESTPQHPLVSVVLFINEGSVGGPTLVTNQTLDGPAADKGWLVHPAENRLVMFNASLLHGVIPGKGINPDINQRRLTFMIGFWRDIAATQRGLDHAGPAQYFPDIVKTKYNWPKIMKLSEFPSVESTDTGSEKVIPQDISAVWEPIDIDERVGANLLVKGLNVPYSLIWQGF